MSDFEVTPQELHDLAGRLSGLLDELSQATGNVRVDRAAAAGAPPLEAAISDFLGRWSGELADLRTQLDSLAGQLAAAGSAYDATESSILNRFAPR